MDQAITITPFHSEAHRGQVIDLWTTVFGYEAKHNEPSLVIQRKEEMKDGLFLVSVSPSNKVTGTVMCGYDGHRGWIYSLAVSPELQRSGVGSALMSHAEAVLRARGCMKINLQIMEGNEGVEAFYRTLGYSAEKRVSMGKRLPSNIPTVESIDTLD